MYSVILITMYQPRHSSHVTITAYFKTSKNFAAERTQSVKSNLLQASVYKWNRMLRFQGGHLNILKLTLVWLLLFILSFLHPTKFLQGNVLIRHAKELKSYFVLCFFSPRVFYLPFCFFPSNNSLFLCLNKMADNGNNIFQKG